MSKRKVEGVCRICRKHGKLSFEHVPPEKAFNQLRTIEYDFDLTTTARKVRGRKQGGVGAHTLCERCNNITGKWYGGEYVTWSHIGFNILAQAKVHNVQICRVTLKKVYPLRFLKQAVVCFFSIMDDDPVIPKPPGGFAQNNPELVSFVLNRDEQRLPSGKRFFLKLTGSHSSGDHRGRKGGLLGKDTSFYSEMAHPPFSVIMTHDLGFPDATEITFFANFGYGEQVDLYLELGIAQQEIPCLALFSEGWRQISIVGPIRTAGREKLSVYFTANSR